MGAGAEDQTQKIRKLRPGGLRLPLIGQKSANFRCCVEVAPLFPISRADRACDLVPRGSSHHHLPRLFNPCPLFLSRPRSTRPYSTAASFRQSHSQHQPSSSSTNYPSVHLSTTFTIFAMPPKKATGAAAPKKAAATAAHASYKGKSANLSPHDELESVALSSQRTDY